MTGRTHAIIGANAVWLVYFFGTVDSNTPLFIAVGALAALLPDIDASTAKIHYLGHGILGMFKNTFRHRGFFHSFLAYFLVYLISFLFLRDVHPLLPLVITAGYASHPLIDSFNGGVQYFFPYKKYFSFIPKPFRFRVGSMWDDLFFILGVFGILWFVVMNYQIIQPSFMSIEMNY